MCELFLVNVSCSQTLMPVGDRKRSGHYGDGGIDSVVRVQPVGPLPDEDGDPAAEACCDSPGSYREVRQSKVPWEHPYGQNDAERCGLSKRWHCFRAREARPCARKTVEW